SGPGPGMPGPGSDTPPSGPGAGMPGAGGSAPTTGPGPGMPGPGGYGAPSGPSLPPLGAGPGMPPPLDDLDSPDGMHRGVGPGMPARAGMGGVPGGGVGPGMPLRRGVGPGMPPPVDSGPNPVMPSSISRSPEASRNNDASTGLGAVEYDDDDEPKRRPLLIVGIAVAVIAGGAGLGWLIVGGNDDPEGDLAKVTPTEKAQDIDVAPDPEPEAPKPDDPEPLELEPKPKPKPKPKGTLTFEQSLGQLKGRIRGKCKKLGPGPIDIDTLVPKDGGKALAPKVKPKGPVGDCALRIVERWSFPESEQDHPVNEKVSW
ncbi:MAG: hypothetical protein KDK70_28330, partial [Myxococcales bacterium]|nr:hypothetical protein [Myxococcales bacterium]